MSAQTLSELRKWAFEQLSLLCNRESPDEIHEDTLKFEIDELLCQAGDCARSDLVAYSQRIIAEEKQEKFRSYVERRKSDEPLAYILGCAEFYEREFVVDSRVLIPRSETEVLVQRALGILAGIEGSLTVVDVGLGSGAILLTIAKELESKMLGEHFLNSRFVGFDISDDALEVAQENASRLNLSSKVELMKGDVLSALSIEPGAGPILILSNPPYISVEESLPKSVAEFEPELALRSGKLGMDVIERFFKEAEIYLRHGAVLLLELGYQQDSLVKSALRAAGEYTLLFHRDLRDVQRIAEVRGVKCESFFPSLEENN